MSCSRALLRRSRPRGPTARIVILAVALVPVGPAEALADERIIAAPGDRYLNQTVEIDQGERLTFLNQDVASHNVRARQPGPDGGPLFTTPTIEGGQEVFVEGSQYLTTGSYAFYCSVHPWMEGSLAVNAAGAPVPRPGTGGTDRQAPVAAVRVPDRRIQTVVRRRALRVIVETDEPVRLRLSAGARVGDRTVRLGTLDRNLDRAGGQAVTIAVGQAARRRLAGASRARVKITGSARDAAGNRANLLARRTLKE